MRHDGRTGGGVPQPDRGIEAAAGQGLAVRAERHRPYLAGTAREAGPDRRAGGDVPQPYGAITTAASQHVAVRAERHRGDHAEAGQGGDAGAYSGGQHRVAALSRGVETPGRHAEQLGGNRIGITYEFAAADQLIRDRDVTLMYSLLTLGPGKRQQDERDHQAHAD